MGGGDEVGDEEEDAVGPILVPHDHWQRHNAFKPNELLQIILPIILWNFLYIVVIISVCSYCIIFDLYIFSTV